MFEDLNYDELKRRVAVKVPHPTRVTDEADAEAYLIMVREAKNDA